MTFHTYFGGEAQAWTGQIQCNAVLFCQDMKLRLCFYFIHVLRTRFLPKFATCIPCRVLFFDLQFTLICYFELGFICFEFMIYKFYLHIFYVHLLIIGTVGFMHDWFCWMLNRPVSCMIDLFDAIHYLNSIMTNVIYHTIWKRNNDKIISL